MGALAGCRGGAVGRRPRGVCTTTQDELNSEQLMPCVVSVLWLLAVLFTRMAAAVLHQVVGLVARADRSERECKKIESERGMSLTTIYSYVIHLICV